MARLFALKILQVACCAVASRAVPSHCDAAEEWHRVTYTGRTLSALRPFGFRTVPAAKPCLETRLLLHRLHSLPTLIQGNAHRDKQAPRPASRQGRGSRARPPATNARHDCRNRPSSIRPSTVPCLSLRLYHNLVLTGDCKVRAVRPSPRAADSSPFASPSHPIRLSLPVFPLSLSL